MDQSDTWVEEKALTDCSIDLHRSVIVRPGEVKFISEKSPINEGGVSLVARYDH